MARGDDIDVEIEDLIRASRPHQYKGPEVFYPRKFVTIKSALKHLDSSTLTKVYHATHLDQIKEICAAQNIANFVGKEKRWRLGPVCDQEKQTYSLQCCSYLVEDLHQDPVAMTQHDQWPFGPFMWFGTRPHDAYIYGTYCFEFKWESVLEKYQQSRGNKSPVCYRAGGTLLYKYEITHIVILCYQDDDEFKSYPLIDDTTRTKYFQPPLPRIECTKPCKRRKDELSSCKDADGKFAVISTNTGLPSNRHEHVVLAFYLPHGVMLQLDNQDGELYDIARDHVKLCVKTPGKYKTCKFCTIDKSYIYDFKTPFDYSAIFDCSDGK